MIEAFSGIAVAAFSVLALAVLTVFLCLNIRNAGSRMVRIIFIVLICLFVIAGVFGSINSYRSNKTIGTYSGSEYEHITIDGVLYVADYDNPYDSSDRDKMLGKVVGANDENHSDPMYVWSVDGTDEYIYALWVADGTFFKKQQ